MIVKLVVARNCDRDRDHHGGGDHGFGYRRDDGGGWTLYAGCIAVGRTLLE